MRVKRVDSFNGRQSYIVEYEGKEYRVRKYDHQADNRTELNVEYVGDNSLGKPQFQQDYTNVLLELYEKNGVYPFTISDECVDPNSQAFYYMLSDQYGLKHRVYSQKNSLYKIGDNIECEVLAVENCHLSLNLLQKVASPATFAIGDLVDLKSVLRTDGDIDFSLLNPEKDTTLRDYQIENKRKIYQAWQKCRSVMLQMPTGTGKTRLFVSIARDLFNYGAARKKAIKILFLAHRKELIEQISDHLGRKYHLAHGLIVSQNMEQKQYPMQIGSVPTLTRRLERWEDKGFDVIIIDEAHHVKAKSYRKIIDFYPSARILGVTATPYRLNGAGFRPEFDELIVSASVADFIKKGYLSEYVYYSIKPTSELQKEIDQMKLDFEGDYKESEMMGVMDRDYIRAGILSSYQKYAEGKKGIVYTISRDHNTHLAKEFNAAGIKAAAIDSETSKEQREELVQKFRRGEIQVLFNVNIFSEGFDCPDVEVIQLARPTKSLAMYLQQVGRGLRPHDEKENLIILDNVGLFNKFGFPSARRKWKYHFEGRPVDESPAEHLLDNDQEEREVNYIFEGNEAVEMLHDSRTEEVGQSPLDNIEHDYEQSFIEYTMQLLNAHTAHSYARTIRPHLDTYIREHIEPTFKSLFNVIDTRILHSMAVELKSNSEFRSFNRKKHNVFTASLNHYLDFAEWYANNLDAGVPLPPVEDSERKSMRSHPDPFNEPDIPDEEIDTEITSLEKVIEFHNKKRFPIPDELLLELARLRRLKKTHSQKAVIAKEFEEQVLGHFDLSDFGKVTYKVGTIHLDVETDFDYLAELRDENEMMELIRIMNKLKLQLSTEIQEKLMLLNKAKDIHQVECQLYTAINAFVTSKKDNGIYIQSLSYSKENGLSIVLSDTPDNPISRSLKTKNAPKCFTVTFPDGTVMTGANATKTFIDALEKIGVGRIKDLGLVSFKRPFIDSTPHDKYPSHQLSSGDYICTQLSNDRKTLYISAISQLLGLNVVAEVK